MTLKERLLAETWRDKDSFKDLEALAKCVKKMVDAGMTQDAAIDLMWGIYNNAASDYGD